jgi:hypothetical protein
MLSAVLVSVPVTGALLGELFSQFKPIKAINNKAMSHAVIFGICITDNLNKS